MSVMSDIQVLCQMYAMGILIQLDVKHVIYLWRKYHPVIMDQLYVLSLFKNHSLLTHLGDDDHHVVDLVPFVVWASKCISQSLCQPCKMEPLLCFLQVWVGIGSFFFPFPWYGSHNGKVIVVCNCAAAKLMLLIMEICVL